jgi:hypothetical protein
MPPPRTVWSIWCSVNSRLLARAARMLPSGRRLCRHRAQVEQRGVSPFCQSLRSFLSVQHTLARKHSSHKTV